ncbi:hypothetical protein ABEB36_003528 [Hypothenemus hampei]|uniref:CMP/dCMP-type deaminase domain-containing protein n=1 Tax=Hypothenemus hampei TaxID=57062 RepID=A0ABD1F9G6_HYPHA
MSNDANSDISAVITLADHEQYFMEKAFFYARQALDKQEVPVGCIFVYENNILAVGRNEVNKTKNATRHAEMICIDEILKHCKENDLDFKKMISFVDVYVTVEPCIMCAAALFNLNIRSITFGCRNDRFGGSTVYDVSKVIKPTTVVKGGYRACEAMELLKDFYKGQNPNAPLPKVRIKKS